MAINKIVASLGATFRNGSAPFPSAGLVAPSYHAVREAAETLKVDSITTR